MDPVRLPAPELNESAAPRTVGHRPSVLLPAPTPLDPARTPSQPSCPHPVDTAARTRPTRTATCSVRQGRSRSRPIVPDMAQIIGGIRTSHVPAVGAAIDHNKQNEPYWVPYFNKIAPVRAWVRDPTRGSPISWCIQERLGLSRAVFAQASCHGTDNAAMIDAMFDQLRNGQGGATGVNAVPGADRQPLLSTGQGDSPSRDEFPGDERVLILGTGGMSHQLQGERAGLVNRLRSGIPRPHSHRCRAARRGLPARGRDDRARHVDDHARSTGRAGSPRSPRAHIARATASSLENAPYCIPDAPTRLRHRTRRATATVPAETRPIVTRGADFFVLQGTSLSAVFDARDLTAPTTQRCSMLQRGRGRYAGVAMIRVVQRGRHRPAQGRCAGDEVQLREAPRRCPRSCSGGWLTGCSRSAGTSCCRRQ